MRQKKLLALLMSGHATAAATSGSVRADTLMRVHGSLVSKDGKAVLRGKKKS